MKELVFLIVFVILSTAFAVAALVASLICAPRTSDNSKKDTYECGMEPFNNSRIQYCVKYFNYVILFLIFDVETIFLFPFAINFVNLQQYAIIEVCIFIVLLLFALFYAIKTDVLRWQ